VSDFEGLVAVVTGGASGIGAATARRLKADGARVVILDRQIPADSDVAAYQCDVTDTDGVERVIAAIVADFGGIDILVNNAGIGAVGDIAANDDAEWHRVLDVNVLGLVRVTRAALPHLRKSEHPAIVNTCSIVARVGVVQRALYSASKGAVGSLTLAMAADHVAEGIRVNAVLPGTADTPWVSRLLADATEPDVAAELLRKRQPMGRLVSAEEVANAICYLASPLSSSTTGTLLTVDGGMGSLRVAAASN
jgi:2-keto-3-deoxy-L-fuconate dehydrogenase